MTRVCFTGRAVVNGVHITRDDLEMVASSAGWMVDTAVGWQTDYLASARTDTKKARDAEACAARVIPYDRFMAMAAEAIMLRPSPPSERVQRILNETNVVPRGVPATPASTDPLTAIIRNMDGTYRYAGRVYATHLEATQAVGRANREREGLDTTPREIVRHRTVGINDVTWTPAMDSRTRHQAGRSTRPPSSGPNARVGHVPLPDAVYAQTSATRALNHNLKVRFFNGEERWIENVEMLARLRIIDPSLQIVGGTASQVRDNFVPAPEPMKPFDMAPARRAIILDDE